MRTTGDSHRHLISPCYSTRGTQEECSRASESRIQLGATGLTLLLELLTRGGTGQATGRLPEALVFRENEEQRAK